jgi:hypothetical protein
MRRFTSVCVIIFAILLVCNFDGISQNKGKKLKRRITIVKDSTIKKVPSTCKSKTCKNDTVKAHCGRFIDKNGDGINDNRCSSMGISKKKRHGKVINADSLAVINKKK